MCVVCGLSAEKGQKSTEQRGSPDDVDSNGGNMLCRCYFYKY